jgi:hypothetical protein
MKEMHYSEKRNYKCERWYPVQVWLESMASPFARQNVSGVATLRGAIVFHSKNSGFYQIF